MPRLGVGYFYPLPTDVAIGYIVSMATAQALTDIDAQIGRAHEAIRVLREAAAMFKAAELWAIHDRTTAEIEDNEILIEQLEGERVLLTEGEKA